MMVMLNYNYDVNNIDEDYDNDNNRWRDYDTNAGEDHADDGDNVGDLMTW